MNDFTKEELRMLKFCIMSSMQPPDEVIAICNKIQSMIDNYCEHQETGNDYPGVLCFKCRRMWE